LGTEGCPPLQIRGVDPDSLEPFVQIPGHVSSQYMTSLMLVAPSLPNGLDIQIQGTLRSSSYIQMTLNVMAAFGIDVQQPAENLYKVFPQTRTCATYYIEGDASGASYLWGLAALTAGTVRVHGIHLNSAQGDAQFPNILKQMGCSIQEGREDDIPWVEVSGPSQLHAVNVDMTEMPDTAMTLAVLAACAKGKTIITGLHTLKHKETDRLLALHQELAKTGIQTKISDHHIEIVGGTPHGAQIATYEDHRMAMCFGMLASCVPNLYIEDPAVVNKSFPNFWPMLEQCGIQISNA
ncbi:MAG: 3-phosphoshikimate 1-carboxyvinyltransferase, partial [Myxococcota bacterium]